jgi:hypothetical protein
MAFPIAEQRHTSPDPADLDFLDDFTNHVPAPIGRPHRFPPEGHSSGLVPASALPRAAPDASSLPVQGVDGPLALVTGPLPCPPPIGAPAADLGYPDWAPADLGFSRSSAGSRRLPVGLYLHSASSCRPPAGPSWLPAWPFACCTPAIGAHAQVPPRLHPSCAVCSSSRSSRPF